MPVKRKIILLTDAPTHAHALISQLYLHQPLLMELILYPLLLGRTTLEEESTMSLWRKLQMLSLICFLSMPLLQLYYLIPEHHIISYLLHMLKSIIY
jgi:hypothetical protein